MKTENTNQPVIIVTGASRGLGAAIAREAAKLGAKVTLTARSEADLYAEMQAVKEAGTDAIAVPGDVSREEDCRNITARTVEQFGRIDGLVNNAGVVEPIGPIADARHHDWERNWSVNVLGPVMLIRLALPYLRQTGGRVINISSGAAENIIGGWGAYSTSKAAINHLTKILAAEEPEITALAIRPGIVDTEMQVSIRQKGRGRMAEVNYQRLYGLYEKGLLLPPEAPGSTIAILALYAPHDWSGEVVVWDDQKVDQLVKGISE